MNGFCLKCGGQWFTQKPDCMFEQEYRWITFNVQSPGVVCCDCGWQTIDLSQLNDLMKNTKRKHAELTKNDLRSGGVVIV